MAALLPPLCFLLTFVVLSKNRGRSLRESFLWSALIWGTFITIATELLSLLRWLDYSRLLGVWGIAALLLLAWLWKDRPSLERFRSLGKLRELTAIELALVLCAFSVVILVGAVAWVAPPNNCDSMTYHMSRVAHWVQNKSVCFYPTAILRQLYQTPWSEFAILQFQILCGSDRCANFVQWFSMAGSIVAVSLVARKLGANRRGQIFAALFCSSIPMGILQGSSTQADYAVTFWLVCFAYGALQLKDRPGLASAIATGAALGLATLTKPTAYVFAFPFLLWLGWATLRQRSWQKASFLALALGICLAFNLSHYARNYALFERFLGPGSVDNVTFTNEIHSAPAVVSNLVRNICIHLCNPSHGVLVQIDRFVLWLHRAMGISTTDPRTTWPGSIFHMWGLSYHEDHAGNPLHFLLILASLCLFLFKPLRASCGFYAFALLTGFVLFCVIFKWQPWHSRLHLSLFVLFAPFVGVVLSQLRRPRIANLIVLALGLCSFPWLLKNSTRPVLGPNSIFVASRAQQYFTDRPEWARPYAESAKVLARLNCSNVGLLTGSEGWEYPLWALLREKPVRLEHVNVANASSRLALRPNEPQWFPEAVLSMEASSPGEITVGDRVYFRTWTSAPISIYIPRTTDSNSGS